MITLKFDIIRYSFKLPAHTCQYEYFSTPIDTQRAFAPEFDPITPTFDSIPKLQLHEQPNRTTTLEYTHQWRWVGIGTKKSIRTVRAYHCRSPIEGTIVKSKRIKMDLEKESVLQRFVQRNLMELFRLKLIKAEFRLGSQSSDDRRSSPRPDTLAFDEEKKCFVVIEYKKEDSNRIYKQLLTYTSAPDRSNHQMEMINTYSKIQKENDSLAPLHADEICWKNYYCIYVSLDISDDLIEDLGSLRKSSDIRMYEIHAFEGAVVLCRVDADKYSKDDGLDIEPATPITMSPHPEPKPPTPSGPTPMQEMGGNLFIIPVQSTPTPDLVPILDLKSNTTIKHNPVALQFPDGTSTNKPKRWATVLTMVASWLSKKGHIKEQSQSNILHAEVHRKPSHRPVYLANGLYINVNLPAAVVLADMQKLLKDIDHEPHNFKIGLKDKIS